MAFGASFRARVTGFGSLLIVVLVLGVSPSFPATDSGSGLRIVVVSGEGVAHRTGRDSVRLPLIRVEDEAGQPINEAEVLFLLPEGGPGASFQDGTTTSRARTNERGLVALRPFKLNETPGEFQIRVEASWQGQRAAGTIRQVSQAKRGAGKKIAIISAVAAGGAGAAAALLRGKDNGPCCCSPAP
jgi:hypothetical protein